MKIKRKYLKFVALSLVIALVLLIGWLYYAESLCNMEVYEMRNDPNLDRSNTPIPEEERGRYGGISSLSWQLRESEACYSRKTLGIL